MAISAALKRENMPVSVPTGATVLRWQLCKQYSMPTTYQLDPRPDLYEDHRLWVAVLAAAWYETAVPNSKPFHGTLHGMRCGGARLNICRSRTTGQFLKLDYQPLLGAWAEADLRKYWLEPNKAVMKTVFQQALDVYEDCKDLTSNRRKGDAV